MEDTPGRLNPLDRKGVSTMADLTIAILRQLIHHLPDNTLLKIRYPDNGEFTTEECGLIGYTVDNELIFLPKPEL